MTNLSMLNWYHPCLLEGDNYNNHEAVRIDRALYRANAALFKLEDETLAKIRRIAEGIEIGLSK